LSGREAVANPLPSFALVGCAEDTALCAQKDDVWIFRVNGDGFNEVVAETVVANFKSLAAIKGDIEAADIATDINRVGVFGIKSDRLNPTAATWTNRLPLNFVA